MTNKVSQDQPCWSKFSLQNDWLKVANLKEPDQDHEMTVGISSKYIDPSVLFMKSLEKTTVAVEDCVAQVVEVVEEVGEVEEENSEGDEGGDDEESEDEGSERVDEGSDRVDEGRGNDSVNIVAVKEEDDSTEENEVEEEVQQVVDDEVIEVMEGVRTEVVLKLSSLLLLLQERDEKSLFSGLCSS